MKADVQKQPANAPLACVTQVPLFWHGFGKQPFNGVVVVVVITTIKLSFFNNAFFKTKQAYMTIFHSMFQ